MNTGIAPLKVPLHLHWSSALLPIAFVLTYGLLGLGMYIILMASLLVHEYSHVWMAQRQNMYVEKVSIYVIGAIAFVDSSSFEDHPSDELKVAIAGPTGSLLLSIFGYALFVIFPNTITALICIINLAMGLFNLLPLYPMDGGRILNFLLTMKIGRQKALNVSLITSCCLGGAGIILCLLNGLYWISFVFAIVILMGLHQKKHESSFDGSSPML